MRKRLFLSLILLLFTSLYFACGGEETEYDLLITNGKIVNGTGNPWFHGDIGIVGDQIIAIGDLGDKSATRVLDAGGFVVAPGFIDLHTHCDGGLGRTPTNSNLNYLSQGVTTVVVGNCGNGSFKVAETKTAWEEQGLGTNAVLLVGFGTVRSEVMGVEDRKPTAAELEKMQALVKQAMEGGAWGISTGLQYIPDRYADTEEVIALTRVVGEYGGIYTSHQRDEEAHLVEAVQETIRIGEETGVRVNAAHFKCAGKENWGLMNEAVRLINETRAAGTYITADMYPYDKAATTSLSALFNVPGDWEEFKEIREKLTDSSTTAEEIQRLVLESSDGLAQALADPKKREAIRKLTAEGDPDAVNWVKTWGWHNFTIVGSNKNAHLVGKIFSDLADEMKKDAFDIAADLFVQEKQDVIISLCAMSEEEMKHAMQQDWLMISSDGGAVPHDGGPVHPRNYGSFPRVLRKYVREEGTLTLEQAVRKMSSLPSSLLKLKDRGLILKGCKADLVIFDPDSVRDNATYLDSHQYSSGVEYVLVNGKITIDAGQYNNELNGKVLLLTEND